MKTNNSLETPPPEFPGFCSRNFYPVNAVAYVERIRPRIQDIISKSDLQKLRELADREDLLAQAADKFDEASAKAAHEEASAKLREDPSPENITALKQLGSVEVLLHHYHAERGHLEAAAMNCRREGLPIIDAASRRLAAVLMELAETARADEASFYSSWGLPSPAESMVVMSVHRAIQEICVNLQRESADRVPTGVGLRGFLAMLGE
jgi:hypothetical protein